MGNNNPAYGAGLDPRLNPYAGKTSAIEAATFGPIMRALLGLGAGTFTGAGQTPGMPPGAVAGGLPLSQGLGLGTMARGAGNITGALSGAVNPANYPMLQALGKDIFGNPIEAKRALAGMGAGAGLGSLIPGVGTIAGGGLGLVAGALSNSDELTNQFRQGRAQTDPSYVPPEQQQANLGQPPVTMPQPKAQGPQTPTGGAQNAPPVDVPDALGGVGVPQGPRNNPDPLAATRARIDESIKRIQELASNRQDATPEEQRVRVLAALAAGASQGLAQGGSVASVLSGAGALGLGEVARIKAEQRKLGDTIADKLMNVEGIKIKTEGDLATLETAIARTAIMEQRLELAAYATRISAEVAHGKLRQLATSAAKNESQMIYNKLQTNLLLYKNQPGMNIDVPGLVGVKGLTELPPQDRPLHALAWGQINDPSSELANAARAQVKEQSAPDIAMVKQTKGPEAARKYEDGLVYHRLLELNTQRFANGDQSVITELARVRQDITNISPLGGMLQQNGQ